MAYNKFRQRTKTKDYMDKTSYMNDDLSKPSKPDGNVDTGISEKSLRNLPKSSYSIQADPYEAALPGSKPYPVLAKFNKKVGGNYKGLRNIDGGNAQQYANSPTSQMLKYVDFILAELPINYRNLPINSIASNVVTDAQGNTDYTGKNLIDEMRKAISEATSVLSSTTFTQMAINNYGIVTDMPMGSAKTSKYILNEEEVDVYDNITDVIYASMIFYQLILQSGLSVFNWHNSMRLKMGTMIRRSWNRETPKLNALFGLFKKKSFLSFMDSIALSFEGEYIDLDEMKQVNMLTLAPSARSEALTDPVLELLVKFNHPTKFKIVQLTSSSNQAFELFDYDTDMHVKVKDNTTYYESDYFTMIDDVMTSMSAEKIMTWARDTAIQASGDTAYYNQIKWRIDGISQALTNFKTKISDIREVLDTMSRTGTVNWTKGYIPKIVKDTDAPIFDNLIINDIYKIMASSSDKVTFNEDTKRWRTFTLWNMYDGIPEYDTWQGGSFLTLSLKDLDYSNDSDGVHKYLPIRFTATDGYTLDTETQQLYDYRVFNAISRDGVEMSIDGKTTITMANDQVLYRLAPLISQNDLKIRVPKLTSNASNGHKSCIYKTMTQIFGLCQVQLSNNTDISLDPDIIAIYQIELEDITNEAITYARANAPFKGTASTVDILGFAGSM